MKDNDKQPDGPSAAMPDEFDRLAGMLFGLPDVSSTRQTTVNQVPVMGVGGSRLFIMQTVRQLGIGDTLFLQTITSEGSLRIALPPAVTDVIARQRDSLGTIVRRKIGKRTAEERKAAGLKPGFAGHEYRKTKGAKRKGKRKKR